MTMRVISVHFVDCSCQNESSSWQAKICVSKLACSAQVHIVVLPISVAEIAAVAAAISGASIATISVYLGVALHYCPDARV